MFVNNTPAEYLVKRQKYNYVSYKKHCVASVPDDILKWPNVLCPKGHIVSYARKVTLGQLDFSDFTASVTQVQSSIDR